MNEFFIEIENEARIPADSNIIKIYEGQKETYHEIIKNCRFYLDLDFNQFEIKDEDSKNFIALLINYFPEFAKSYYQCDIASSQYYKESNLEEYNKLSEEEKKNYHFFSNKISYNTRTGADFYLSKCTETNNYHIYIDFYFYDIPFRSSITNIKKIYAQFSCPSKQLLFWKDFKIFLATKTDLNLDFLDMALYKRNAQFRTIYSPKYGKNRYYKPVKVINVEETPKEKEIYKQFYFANTHHKNTGFDKEFFDADRFYDIIEEQSEQIKTERILTDRSQYEILEFEYILQHSKFNIDKRQDWISAIYKIFCFYNFLPVIETRQKIIDFCSARGWDSEENKNENITIVNSFYLKKYSRYYSIETLRNFFEVSYFVKETNTNKFIYPLELSAGKAFLVKSGTGTCKTKNFFKRYNGKGSILYLTYRIALAQAVASKYKLKLYNEIKPAIDECPSRLVCTIHSLYKFRHWTDNFDYIFIDESEEIFNSFSYAIKDDIAEKNEEETDKTIKFAKQSATSIMLKTFFKKKKVVCASANLGFKTISALNNFEAKISCSIKNIYQDKKDYKIYNYTNGPFFKKSLFDLIAQDKKIIFPVNRAKTAVKYSQEIQEKFPNKKVLCITAEIKKTNKDLFEALMKDINAVIVNYDIFIYSPVLEAGVSIEVKHFDYIMAYFISDSNNYQGAYQMLFRCRAPINKHINIFIAKSRFKKLSLEDKKKIYKELSPKLSSEDISCEDLEKYNNLFEETAEEIIKEKENLNIYNNHEDKINFNDSFFQDANNYNMLDAFNKTIVLSKFFNNYSTLNFRSLMKNELINAGAEWITIEDKIKPENKQKEKKIKEINGGSDNDFVLEDFKDEGFLYKQLNNYTNLNRAPKEEIIKNIVNKCEGELYREDITKIIQYFNLYSDLKDNKSACMFNLIEFFAKNKVKNEDLDKYLIKFFEQKLETVYLAFEVARNNQRTKLFYTELDAPEAKRKQKAINRLQAVNTRLSIFSLKLEKGPEFVKLKIFNEDLINYFKTMQGYELTDDINI